MSLAKTIHLSDIYHSIKYPDSEKAQYIVSYFRTIDIKTIEYLCSKLLDHKNAKNDPWPTRRLIRCLEFIFIHGLLSKFDERANINKFMKCLDWVIDILKNRNANMNDLETSLTMQTAVKFICCLVEGAKTKNKSLEKHLIAAQLKITHILLFWLQSPIRPIKLYAIRAIIAQIDSHTNELSSISDYKLLTQLIADIPNLLVTLSLSPPVTDAAQQSAEFDHCVMVCRLFEAAFKYDASNKEKLTSQKACTVFANTTELFSSVAHIWMAVCKHQYYLTVHKDKASRTKPKNLKFLLYYLTNIVQICTTISKSAVDCVGSNTSRVQWQPLLAILLQQWVSVGYVQDQSFDSEKNIIMKLLKILNNVLPQKSKHQIEHVTQTLLDLTNALMAFVSLPIPSEQISVIGSKSLIHKDVCVDTEERGYLVEQWMVIKSRELVGLLLESLIRYVQLASTDFIQSIAGRVSWSLKSLLTILLNINQLEYPSIQPRIEKLVMFFLHYDECVHIFAASTTNISEYIWGPTIKLAKEGLKTAVELTPEADLTSLQVTTIYKAKRAFVALEKISKHPRACERLVDCKVLQLVDADLIPPGKVMEKTTSLLACYALFGRFIAALSRRTAFVRTRLRDECHLFQMIIKLLNEAISLKKTTSQDIIDGWNHVISSCLMVISAFQYDELSMQLWLSCQKVQEKEEEGRAHKRVRLEIDQGFNANSRDTVENNHHLSSKISVLPCVLSILFPWRNSTTEKVKVHDIYEYLKADHKVMVLAAQVLDQLSCMHLFGRQMISDKQAMFDLSSLLVCLTGAYTPDKPETMFELTSSSVIDDQEDENKKLGNYIVHDENNIKQLIPSLETTNRIDPAYITEEITIDEEQTTTSEEPPNFKFAGYLKRTAVRIFSSHENIQGIILSDAFTTFFQPMIYHPAQKSSQFYWLHTICSELYTKKFKDYSSLFHFTKSQDSAIKLHEFTAVALGYLMIGVPSDMDWNQKLGLNICKGDGHIVSNDQLLSILCQMLAFELEYEQDSHQEQDSQEQPNVDTLLLSITPFRRNAAAQVIETLTLYFENIWYIETESIREIKIQAEHIEFQDPTDIVHFVTDDAAPGVLISGNRQLLRLRSPIFNALLSGEYAESTLEAIPLHDVTFHGLNLFISIIHQLNDSQQNSVVVIDVLNFITCWQDIIDLLKIADRFGSSVVKHLCEHWVLEKVKHLNKYQNERFVCLEGMLRLYRQCRDPIEKDSGITSDTWPFSTVLRECLKSISQHMSEACQTNEFIKMVQEKNIDELDAFCDGLAYLLTSK